jgi:hypothetical protein
MTIASPIRTDEQAQLVFTGAPSELAFVLFAPRPDAVFVPSLPDALFVGTPSSSLFVGQLDASGTATLQLAPPDPGPGNLGTTLYVQAWFFDPSAPVGERLELAPPSSVVVSDASL